MLDPNISSRLDNGLSVRSFNINDVGREDVNFQFVLRKNFGEFRQLIGCRFRSDISTFTDRHLGAVKPNPLERRRQFFVRQILDELDKSAVLVRFALRHCSGIG